jgi:hypothetical protein
MWNRKAAIVLMSARIGCFPLFIVFPLRCLDEVMEGWTDVMCLFRRANAKAFAALSAVDDALAMLRAYGPLDMVDVDVAGNDEHVKVRLLLR